MWPSMRGLWKARRARRAAVATIAPLVERSRYRLNGTSDVAWLDSYMVGFMVMLITFVVRREVGILETQALGLVQCEAWGEITGIKSDIIGEEVLLLSAARHKNFELGCRNAIAFGEALYGNTMGPTVEQPALEDMVFHGAPAIGGRTDAVELAGESGIVAALWAECFDAHVAGAPLAVSH
jgi:hypothetical protein